MQGRSLPWKPGGLQTDRNCDTTESDAGHSIARGGQERRQRTARAEKMRSCICSSTDSRGGESSGTEYAGIYTAIRRNLYGRKCAAYMQATGA